MKLKTVHEYKLKGERNVRPRRPLAVSDKLFVIFVYDKKGFVESKIQCLSVTEFTLLWEYTHPHIINNLVLTENSSLLACCMNGEVFNFSLEDGSIIWKFNTPEGNIGPMSNEANSRVVFSGVQGNQSTWCIDTITGAEVWKVKNNGHSYHPSIYTDKILNTIGNDLNCLDLTSGKTLWKVSESKTYLFNPKVVNNLAIAAGHGLVNFYNLGTGNHINTIQTGQPNTVIESSIREIIADSHSIYFGDAKGFFYSYSLPDLNNNYNSCLRWKIETNGGIESIPLLYRDHILVINNGKQFLSIDQSSGDITQEIKIKGEAFISGLTVNNDEIFYSCSGGYVVKCIA